MKCLINLGVTEKIITFALNARMTEIFILAGNYLYYNLLKIIILFNLDD